MEIIFDFACLAAVLSMGESCVSTKQNPNVQLLGVMSLVLGSNAFDF
jgi:hypothetical protein